MLNSNFKLTLKFDHLFPSMSVISFDNFLTSDLTPSTNSSVSDFISLGKLFMNIKNNKIPTNDP